MDIDIVVVVKLDTCTSGGGMERFVEHYSTKRLHSILGHITPKDKLENREKERYLSRQKKLKQARERRKQLRALEKKGHIPAKWERT